MITGFVLIITDAGKEHSVYAELNSIKEVDSAYPLFGEYDIIVKVHGADHVAIGMTVVDKIRTIPGVADTKTLTSIIL